MEDPSYNSDFTVTTHFDTSIEQAGGFETNGLETEKVSASVPADLFD